MVVTETRIAHPADLERLAAIWEEQQTIEAQLDPRLTLDPIDLVSWRAAIETGLTQEFQQSVVFVAVRHDTILGFAHIGQPTADANYGRLYSIAVDPHDGGRGVGTALLDAASSWLRSHALVHLIVRDVPRHIAVQQAFWRAKGASTIRETLYLPVAKQD